MKKSRRQLGYPANWSISQRFRIRECIAKGDTIAYWCSDAHGRPCNGGSNEGYWQAKLGLIQTISGQFEICKNALHATFEPHRWNGNRVWVVALSGQVEKGDDKFGASIREFLGEVLPEEAMSPSVGLRLGRKDLSGATLSRADLSGADLSGAYLSRADLSGAYLTGADLYKSNLSGANLTDSFRSFKDPKIDGWELINGRLQRK